MLDRLSATLPSASGVREVVRDIPDVVRDAAGSARRALTVRRLAWTAGVVLAFAVPYAAGAARGGETAPGSAVLEPPARVEAPALPQLSDVAPLPEPPRVVRRRPPAVAPAPVATPVPVPTPEAAVPAPAPAPAPAPERETFDLEG